MTDRSHQDPPGPSPAGGQAPGHGGLHPATPAEAGPGELQPPGHPGDPAAAHPAHGAGGRHEADQAAHLHPAPRRPALSAGDALYLSATFLSTIWALVLLFVVYPQSPVDAGYADDDVPVMSLQGSVVTVKRAALAEALASHQYLQASREQVEYFEERRNATVRDVKRDKLFWFVAAAAFPGLGLLLFRIWYSALRRA